MRDETKNVMKMPEVVDGFDSDADDSPQGRRVIQGRLLRFTNDFTWVDGNDEEISPDLELIVADRARVLQKWIEQKPVETRFLEPGEKWPDVAALNDAVPQSQWRKQPGSEKLQGPWQCQHVLYMLDPLTLDKYSYPTNTTGGHIAVGDLVDRIKTMRRLRGTHVYPVITLSDTFMNTQWGGRQRPHLKIQRWVMLGPSERALPAPEGPRLLDTTTAEKTVKEPTLAEEMGDAVPNFNDPLPEDLGGPQAAPTPPSPPPPSPPKPAKPQMTRRGVQKIARR